MPSPRVARATTKKDNAPAKDTRTQGALSTPSLGIYDTNSVKARISKWQALNEIDIPLAEPSAPQAPLTALPTKKRPYQVLNTASPAQEPSKPIAGQPLNKTTKARQKPLKKESDLKTGAAPKKRLVSDEHWKKGQKDNQVEPESRLPRNKPGAWVRPKANPAKSWEVQPLNDVPSDPSPDKTRNTNQRAADKSKALDGASASIVSNASGEVSPQRVTKEGDLNAKNLRQAFAPPLHDRGPHEPGSPPKNVVHPALQFFAGRPIPDPPPKEPKQPSPAKKPTDLRPALQFLAGRAPPPLQANAVRSHSPDRTKDTPFQILKNVKTPDSVPATGQLGRIEAWLSDESDPFIDSKPPTGAAPANHGESMNPYEKEREEEHRKRRERRRSRHQKHTPDREPPIESEGSCQDLDDTLGHSRLKRSGARRNQHSPRTHRYSPPSSTLRPQPADPASVLADFKSVVPDDSASMMFMRPASSPRMDSEQLLNPTDASNALVPAKKTSVKRRKLTSQTDLISVLSEAAPVPGSLVSACSLRSARSRPGEATISELMAEMKNDEEKYDRELRTLIDGVIPVLLTCVLSKGGASAATQLFSPNTAAANATAPIVNMGVALERLRSIHRRLPLTSADALMIWASQAHRVYADYIKAWRLGFQDVVVNLAPAEDGGNSQNASKSRPQDHLDRNSEGYIVDQTGQKVDVAHLLKRPLVRLKHLAKTFKGFQLAKSSLHAKEWADKYHELVEAARARQSEERARLEDEAAAAIDATRTRDPQTLAPLAGVQIDPSKRVRARDFFDLRLHHSTSQRLDCHVELILRDGAHNSMTGDVLFCEVDSTSRWLLFPPIKLDCVSARLGQSPGEIVAMIRSNKHSQLQWSELVSLHHEDHQAGSEWLSMLGTLPVPPKVINPAGSFPSEANLDDKPRMLTLPEPLSSRGAEQGEVHVPFGEQASVISRQWESSPSSAKALNKPKQPNVSAAQSARGAGSSVSSPILKEPQFSLKADQLPQTPPRSNPDRERSEVRHDSAPGSDEHAFRSDGPLSSSGPRSRRQGSEPKESRWPTPRADGDYDRMRRFARREELSDVTHQKPSSHEILKKPNAASESAFSVWMPGKGLVADQRLGSPSVARSTGDFNSQNKSGIVSKMTRDIETPQVEHPDRGTMLGAQQMHNYDGAKRSPKPFSNGTESEQTSYRSKDLTTLSSSIARKSPRASAQKYFPESGRTSGSPSPVPSEVRQVHSSPKSPYAQSPMSPFGHTRSSSPLKHEYEPSTASDNSADGQILSEEEDAMSISSASSAEDIVPSLLPVNAYARRKTGPDSVFAPRNAASLTPSQSASQAPYRSVPADGQGGEKKIASIYCWSDKGAWEPLHPDECSIVVSPGLIEAYEMSAAHSGSAKVAEASTSSPYFSPRPEGVPPLVGLELTPLVPLRRGTAIDISIRSPLTKESVLKPSTNNIMFRSRNNLECERLYNAINQARINNPTYIALQNARPGPESSWGAYMDAKANGPASTWWRFGRRKSSYRAGSSRRTPSIAAQTHDSETSAATMTSAISALRRFTSGSRMFNVAKSTITHGGGMRPSVLSRSSATQSSSSIGGHGSENAGSGASTPPAGVGLGLDPASGSPLGINGARIRLYSREGAGRWRDMGSARLIIMQPPRPLGAPPTLTPDGRLKQEKRIVIQGGHSDVTLLDVTLGESAFERVARTGIALSVWEQKNEIGPKGSVMVARVRVYMLQMKSEAEAAYTFSLVGRLRH